MDLKKKYTQETGEKPYCWTKSGMHVKSGSYSDGYVKWLEKQLLIHSMETFTWNTEYAHNDNEQTMQEWLHEYCELGITLTDGAYAEGMDKQGNLWAIHVSGNSDPFNHKIEFEAL